MSVPDNYDVIKVTSSDATIRVDIDWDYSDLSELYIWQQDDASGVVYYYDQGQFTVVEKTDGTGDYIEVQNVTTGTAVISTARQTPQTQTYDLLNSEPLDPVALINALDKNAKKIQEMFSTVGTPDRQVITSVNPFDVPDKVTRAGKLMSFDENGDVQFTTSDEALDTAIGYAEEWANNPEDQLVSAGAGGDQVDDYSALHHSAKASAQRVLAETARTGAETAETNAQTAQANAEIAESNALASENKAQLWAEEAEDVEVETGQYSAFHWAQKAEENSGVDFITQQGSNANGNYRVWNSGLIEQWGEHVQGATNIVTITLPIPFTSSIDYISCINAANGSISEGNDVITNACGRDGASLTTIKITSDSVADVESTFWHAKGY